MDFHGKRWNAKEIIFSHSNPGTPTKKVLFSCENSTFSFKGKNIIEDELQFRVKVQFHYFYFMTLPP